MTVIKFIHCIKSEVAKKHRSLPHKEKGTFLFTLLKYLWSILYLFTVLWPNDGLWIALITVSRFFSPWNETPILNFSDAKKREVNEWKFFYCPSLSSLVSLVQFIRFDMKPLSFFNPFFHYEKARFRVTSSYYCSCSQIWVGFNWTIVWSSCTPVEL